MVPVSRGSNLQIFWEDDVEDRAILHVNIDGEGNTCSGGYCYSSSQVQGEHK
jgi:hypothetical protein